MQESGYKSVHSGNKKDLFALYGNVMHLWIALLVAPSVGGGILWISGSGSSVFTL